MHISYGITVINRDTPCSANRVSTEIVAGGTESGCFSSSSIND
jgi:hypothetical protein